jgi:hypothetical protein
MSARLLIKKLPQFSVVRGPSRRAIPPADDGAEPWKTPKTDVDPGDYFSRTSSTRPIGVFCFRV